MLLSSIDTFTGNFQMTFAASLDSFTTTRGLSRSRPAYLLQDRSTK